MATYVGGNLSQVSLSGAVCNGAKVPKVSLVRVPIVSAT